MGSWGRFRGEEDSSLAVTEAAYPEDNPAGVKEDIDNLLHTVLHLHNREASCLSSMGRPIAIKDQQTLHVRTCGRESLGGGR